ncbi:MAG TPA: DUF6348 family protein [Gemmataceae bacterium]|jgi:hypothetical protein|nr:DUF6348 family protein [Gemmataceae bacterium]
MFGFGKKNPPPPLCRSNPGIGLEARVAFSTGDRSWTETVDLISLAAAALNKHSYSVKNEKTWLLHPDSGIMILPQLVGIEPLEKGGVRTVTTMQTNHPTLSPAGVFEYQHSAAGTVAESIAKGFEQWVQTDFVPLMEALRPRPEKCTTMEMSFPETADKPPRFRRAILGPVAHLMTKPPPQPNTSGEAQKREGVAEEPDHPFCPCCLLTNSFQAFKGLLEDDAFYGLRLFAARDENGDAQADCRVNGEDFEPGAQALREYARTWPEAGYEFRKQYVILQSIDKLQDIGT